MQPLNDFLKEYQERRKESKTAHKWLTFHDADEYIFPVDVNLTLPEALEQIDNTCCVQASMGSNGWK